MSIATPLMTADEFLKQYGDESGVELIPGLVVRLPRPGGKHGQVCFRAALELGGFIDANRLGRVCTNDTFVRTRQDACRGADLLYLSYATPPADQPTPTGAVSPPVDLVVEVRSPTDSVRAMTKKADEYLDAGVKVVVILDPASESAAVFRADEFPQRFHNGDELTLPDVLPGFAVPVKRFFE